MKNCTCGYGGYHEPLNPRCDRNQGTESGFQQDNERVRRHQQREAARGPVTELALTSVRVGGYGTALRLTFVHADGSRVAGAVVGSLGRVTDRAHRYPCAVVTVDGKPVA